MNISLEKRGDITLVHLDGRLDATNSPEVEGNLLAAVQDVRQLVLNMNDLCYISSAGLRVLLLLARKINSNGGKMALCSLSSGVGSVFDISGFSTIFKIADDCDSAIRMLNT